MFSGGFAGNIQTAIFLFGLLTVSGLFGLLYLLVTLAKSRRKGGLFFVSLIAVGLNAAFYGQALLIPAISDASAATYFSKTLVQTIPKSTDGRSLHIAVPRHDGNLCIDVLGQSSFNSNYCWIYFPHQISPLPEEGKFDFIVTGTGPYKRWGWTDDPEACRAQNPHMPTAPCIAPTEVANPDTDLHLNVVANQTARFSGKPVAIFVLTDRRNGKTVDEFHHSLGQRGYDPLSATLYTRRTDGPIRQMVMSD